jgi:cardiolipin synthase A/B
VLIGGFSIFYILYIILAVSFSIQILFDNKTPQSSVAWILAIFLIPYLGVLLYVLLGINWRRKKMVRQRPEHLFGEHLREVLDLQSDSISEEKDLLGSDMHKIMTLTMKSANAIITNGNTIRLYHQGAALFEDLISDLEDAEISIHLEYFIFRDDEVGRRILSILRKKAADGVEVRLLVDGAGSKLTFSHKGRRSLKRSRVEQRNFLDPGNIVSARLMNYRTHRKIVVIDNVIAYTGGMNIGKEYIDGGRRFDSWRDTHMRVQGPSSFILQSIFLADWSNSGGTLPALEKFFSGAHLDTDLSTTSGVQLITSGPDSDWYAILQLYFTMITNANERVIIQSPYFVPDESIAVALENAALSGIEVNLMITGHPDKRIPFWVAFTFFEPLLKAGVHIYLYTAGFFHSKVVIIDDGPVTMGSCNMDQRSFFLDYELNAIMYDKSITQEFIRQFEIDCQNSQLLDLDTYMKLSEVKKFRNSVFRLIAPLL